MSRLVLDRDILCDQPRIEAIVLQRAAHEWRRRGPQTGLVQVRTGCRIEMRGFAAEIQKIGCQRLRDASQILGDVACISASSEYATETGLLGWACRTRTQKCRRKLCL